MHELSIALSIIEVAEEEAAQRGAKVCAVHLRLGPLSGVVKEALVSAYELACEQSSLAGSQLIIEEVPIVGFCPACKAERTLTLQSMLCPNCNGPVSEFLQGRELQVAALELVELEAPI